MTVKASTGLRNYMLDTGSAKAGLNLGFIKIYAGVEPATADASLGSATLLCTLSNNSTGTGLTLEAAAAAGIILKNAAETWSGNNVAGGVAAFYRHVAPGDTGASSTTERRVQGSIATAGADMNMSNTTLVNGAPQTLDYYAVALPTL
jgi:hypothetical protein